MRQGEGDDFEVFDRNIRLDFRLVPEEEDDKPTFVVTAIPRYRTMGRYANADGEGMLEISGEVDIREDNQILVVLEAEMEFRSGEKETGWHVSTGVLLKPGEEFEVARMGEKTLVVRASYPGKSQR